MLHLIGELGQNSYFENKLILIIATIFIYFVYKRANFCSKNDCKIVIPYARVSSPKIFHMERGANLYLIEKAFYLPKYWCIVLQNR